MCYRKPDLSRLRSFILYTVNHLYDPDTAAAVAGAILGNYWGESGIQDQWKNRVEKSRSDRGVQARRRPAASRHRQKRDRHDRGPEAVLFMMKDFTFFETEDGKILVNAIPPPTLKAQYEDEHGIDSPLG